MPQQVKDNRFALIPMTGGAEYSPLIPFGLIRFALIPMTGGAEFFREDEGQIEALP